MFKIQATTGNNNNIEKWRDSRTGEESGEVWASHRQEANICLQASLTSYAVLMLHEKRKHGIGTDSAWRDSEHDIGLLRKGTRLSAAEIKIIPEP